MSTQQPNSCPGYLDVLLHKLTAHADVVRHHIPNQHHNYTLGFAAEAGVRAVLSHVLPRRLAVTSGFVRSTGGKLIIPTQKNDISGQTDVIIYDTMQACPLYSVEGVELVAADDVLAVIEVKDSSGVAGDLADALEHTRELAAHVPKALRCIVLIQGETLDDAQKKIKSANFEKHDAPHVIFCRSLEYGQPYLAFHEYLTNTIHLWDYKTDPVSALVGFLRIVASFLAAQNLCS